MSRMFQCNFSRIGFLSRTVAIFLGDLSHHLPTSVQYVRYHLGGRPECKYDVHCCKCERPYLLALSFLRRFCGRSPPLVFFFPWVDSPSDMPQRRDSTGMMLPICCQSFCSLDLPLHTRRDFPIQLGSRKSRPTRRKLLRLRIPSIASTCS